MKFKELLKRTGNDVQIEVYNLPKKAYICTVCNHSAIPEEIWKSCIASVFPIDSKTLGVLVIENVKKS